MEYSNIEYADMVFLLTDGNGHLATILWLERFPNRRVPRPNTFLSTYRRLRENAHVRASSTPPGYFINEWPDNQYPSDTDKLCQLNLPKTFKLNIINLNNYPKLDGGADVRIFVLNVSAELLSAPKHYKMFKFSIMSDRIFAQLKEIFENKTKMAVNHQLWQGWPQSTDVNTTLHASGISYPQHNLHVIETRSVPITPENNGPNQHIQPVVDFGTLDLTPVISSPSSDDVNASEEQSDENDSSDSDSHMYVDVLTRRMPCSLIDRNVDDQLTGSTQFIEEFPKRYGDKRPEFFLGTFEQAIRRSCSMPAKDKRLLAVYLHHDGSVLSNIFCSQILCAESVVDYLNTNCVVWGWDMTHRVNKKRLLESVYGILGRRAKSILKSIDMNNYPVVVLIGRHRSKTEILKVIKGECNLGEFIWKLVSVHDKFVNKRQIEIKEEMERKLRERLKEEQDKAFNLSLAVDRAKEDIKIGIEKEKARLLELKKIQDEKIAAEKEAKRKQIIERFPDEPKPGDEFTQIRFKSRLETTLIRRFMETDTLKMLLDYLFLNGFDQEDYKVLSCWPKRDLTKLDKNQTMRDLKMCPQETFMLEEI